MPKQRPFILPWEPEYTAHREAQRRLNSIRLGLARRELDLREAEAPPIAPDHPVEEREEIYAYRP